MNLDILLLQDQFCENLPNRIQNPNLAAFTRQTTVKNTQTETHPLSNILNPTIQQISKTKEQNPQTYVRTSTVRISFLKKCSFLNNNDFLSCKTFLYQLIFKRFFEQEIADSYGNTGCRVFKLGIQNQKKNCLKINLPKGNY